MELDVFGSRTGDPLSIPIITSPYLPPDTFYIMTTGTQHMTVIEFLNARLDEAEALILDGWDSDGEARIATMWTGSIPGYTTVASDHVDDIWIANGREVIDPRHITVLFDPAAILADIRAKRQIINRLASYLDNHISDDFGGEQLANDILALFVEPFASHPEFKPEWATIPQ